MFEFCADEVAAGRCDAIDGMMGAFRAVFKLEEGREVNSRLGDNAFASTVDYGCVRCHWDPTSKY